MIRWLFVLLIIINLGLFLWGTQREAGRGEPPAEPEIDVPPVVLLDEPAPEERAVESPEIGRRAEAHAVSMADASDERTEDSEAKVPDRTPGDPEGAIVEDTDAPSEPRFSEGAPAVSANAGVSPSTVAGANAGVSPSTVAGAVAPIAESSVSAETFPEASNATMAEGLEEETENLEEAAETYPPEGEDAEMITGDRGIVSRCYTVGPFETREDAEKGLEKLAQLDEAADMRQAVDEKHVGYWVLIDQQESRGEAIAKVAELKAAGFSDVWRFTKGRLANAISLGLFARPEQAERHRKQIAAKGFPAEVKPRYVERSVYWVDVDGSGRDISDDTMNAVTDSYADIKVLQQPCP